MASSGCWSAVRNAAVSGARAPPPINSWMLRPPTSSRVAASPSSRTSASGSRAAYSAARASVNWYWMLAMTFTSIASWVSMRAWISTLFSLLRLTAVTVSIGHGRCQPAPLGRCPAYAPKCCTTPRSPSAIW